MMTGMLWFDNDPKTALTVKVDRAVEYYRQKYGHRPDLCLVHPSMLTGDLAGPDGIVIRPYRAVLPGHLWIGKEEHGTAEERVSVRIPLA
jgi:hypothetical protein